MTKEVNVVLQAKGGCGKSFAMNALAQYALENLNDVPVYCFDVDTSNHTLSKFKSLNVQTFDLIPEGHTTISQKRCETFFEHIIEQGEGRFIIDVGATAFQSLLAFMQENQFVPTMKDLGYTVNLHTVLSPKQDLIQTVMGLDSLAFSLSTGKDIVVWINQRNQEIRINGLEFEETDIYKKLEHTIKTVITLPYYSSDTIREDIPEIMAAGLTFSEAIESEDFSVFSRNRLKKVKAEYFAEIGKLYPQTSEKIKK